MKITTNNSPQILQFDVRMNKGDKLYHSCMWGIVNLDLKYGIKSACTDCGNYAYRWTETDREFLKLMAAVDNEYLLRKIARRTKFDLECTIDTIIDYYGDEVEITPLEENSVESDYWGFCFENINTGKEIRELCTLPDVFDNYTPYSFDIINEDIPKKPYEDNGYMICPNCMEVVTDDFSECDNCGQTIDWD